jgi:uncharacterized SAM-binding protein YcdF (DUF218 family)
MTLSAPMRWVLRCLGATALAGFLLAAFSPLPNLVAARVAVAPDPGPADAIVVLGGGVEWPQGELSSTALHRTLHGIRLYRDGRAPLLVLSGGPERREPAPASLRSALALACGVPAPAVIADERARTTREEAGHVASLLRPRGARSILLVTDPYHMRRARRLFQAAGFTVRPAPASDLSDPAETPQARLALMARATQEVLAIAYYWIGGHP